MIKFSANDEQFLDTIHTPPATPPISDEEVDEKDKSLWYVDPKSTPDPAIAINLSRPHGNLCFLAGETIEVDVHCTVRQLQLLSGFLEGLCVANGKVEDTFCFQEVLLYPHQQHQENPFLHLEPEESKNAERNGKNPSTRTPQNGSRHFKFWLTIPITAPPAFKVNANTGVFYRVRVCGIGETVHHHILPHHASLPHHIILSGSVPHIGGVDNYVPIKVRNNTCSYVSRRVLCEKPQTSFTITAPIAGGDITLKVHLVGTPYCILGQLCTFFVTVDNASEKHTKGLTVKFTQRIHSISSSRAFLKNSNDGEEPPPNKQKTVMKYNFGGEEYSCAPHGKLQTQLAVSVPHTFTPTIAMPNLNVIYGLLVRVNVSSTHGLAHEMPILMLPCQLATS